MSLLLAIETSQHVGSVAVAERAGDSSVQSETLSPKKRHDDDLLPAIDRLFQRCRLTPRDLAGESGSAVVVSIGPGGFTGLRIAVATAKMFAESLGTKIIAAPSAVVAAESMIGRGPILVALASKNDTFWCARLERPGHGWEIAGAPGIVDARTMPLDDIRSVIADEFFPGDARGRCARAGIPVVEPVFDARACLMVGMRMLGRGETTDPLHLLPLYPRQPEAVTIWERRDK
jgi:tRNA threonylcarbamoyladenosine biosynthesis protein TsaB